MAKGVKLIKRRVLYSGSISLRSDKFSLNGKMISKEIIEHKNSVGIVPIMGGRGQGGRGDDDNDDDVVILITQYRHPAEQVLLEIPAGKMEDGETPKQAAAREMVEEIGYSGKLKLLLKWYLAPGYSTEFMHVFVATELRKIKRGTLDDDENIRIRKMRLNDALKKCLDGKIKDCKTIAALLAYYHNQSE